MISVLIILALVVIEASVHWYVIEKKKKDPKDNSALMVMRTLIYISVAIGLAGTASGWSFGYAVELVSWIGAVVVVRWALFDYALNIMRGKDLFYLGNKTFDDKIEQKFNGTLLIIIKALFYIGVSALIIF